MNPILFFAFFQLPAAPDAAERAIRADDLRAHVYFLASEELEGREAGSLQEKLAGRYLAEILASYRVRPAGPGGSYFQGFEIDDAEMQNVAGWVEGTDPERKGEFVILGAHYDHVGWGGPESLSGERAIHNGADDNASGTAALLEMAQAFSLAPPRRSVLFLFFAAEEKGLWGSAHYCDEPLFPLGQAAAMLNLDMVGRSRDGYLFVGGTGTGSTFPEILAEAGKGFSFRLETKPGGMAPSDNTNFYGQDVPVLFFFTNVHEDYHAPGDDWWKLNYEGAESVARFAHRVARAIADRPERPEFREDPGMSIPDDFGKKMMELLEKSGRIPEKGKGGKKRKP